MQQVKTTINESTIDVLNMLYSPSVMKAERELSTQTTGYIVVLVLESMVPVRYVDVYRTEEEALLAGLDIVKRTGVDHVSIRTEEVVL